MNIVKCEAEGCDNTFIRGYGYCIAANWLHTGHHAVSAFICPEKPSGQHYGCSPEHAWSAFMHCLDNHMSIDQLIKRHENTGKPRYLPEHEDWAKDLGEKFHIVKIEGAGNVIN